MIAYTKNVVISLQQFPSLIASRSTNPLHIYKVCTAHRHYDSRTPTPNPTHESQSPCIPRAQTRKRIRTMPPIRPLQSHGHHALPTDIVLRRGLSKPDGLRLSY